MPAATPVDAPLPRGLRRTACKRLRTGNMIVHSSHSSPLIITGERDAEKRRLVVSLGGNARWIGKDEKVVTVPKVMRDRIFCTGLGISSRIFSKMVRCKMSFSE
jgi:hypothetical protein